MKTNITPGPCAARAAIQGAAYEPSSVATRAAVAAATYNEAYVATRVGSSRAVYVAGSSYSAITAASIAALPREDAP